MSNIPKICKDNVFQLMGMGVTVSMFMFLLVYDIIPIEDALQAHEAQPAHREADVTMTQIYNKLAINGDLINVNSHTINDFNIRLAVIESKLTNIQERIP